MVGKRTAVVLASCGHVPPLPHSDAGRKRTRLDFLTEEEKVLRRKLLNREAAQKARDRKKNSILLMEQSIRSLQSENQSLRQTISLLKHKCQEQEMRLNSIHYQLGLSTNGDQTLKSEQIEPSEPAVLFPLQQGVVLCVLLLICLSFPSSGFVQSAYANDFGVIFQDDVVADISSEVTIPSQSTEDSAYEVDIAPIVSAPSLYAEIYKSFVDETIDVPLTPSSSADSIDEILKYLSDEDLSGVLDNDLPPSLPVRRH
uniref:X-box-binding protein 1 n=1 Tax=Echinococcus canadensis TaxID=519352 RepID=A0A915EXF1_9CEST